MELTYDISNRNHRGVEGGALDLDPVIEEEGMEGDEVETMVRRMEDMPMDRRGLRYDSLRLLNLVVMGIIYHTDHKLPRISMDRRKPLLIKSMLGGENQ